MSILFANFASTTLAGPISNVATTLNVASGTGALFPSPSNPDLFKLVLNDAATGLLYEVCNCTAVSGDTLTVTRGQEGTGARSWLAGDVAANFNTAGTMQAMVQQVTLKPTRIVTTSGAFTITTNDANGFIGLNRTSGVATSSATLPSGAVQGQSYAIQDLAKNFAPPNSVTISYPVGHTGPGGATTQVLNVNGQTCSFLYYGGNQWGFNPT
jgi:hypothetical protein